MTVKAANIVIAGRLSDEFSAGFSERFDSIVQSQSGTNTVLESPAVRLP